MTSNNKTDLNDWKDRFLSLLLYPLPHHWISRLVFFLTRRQTRLKNPAIRWFIRCFNVDMGEAITDNVNDYPTFNAFFTRELKAGVRPIDADDESLVSPADSTISQLGEIESGTLIQAKGRSYTSLELLGGQHQINEPFQHGKFATLYLSPRDYHRVHMPISGSLNTMIYIPGRLFSVAPHTVRAIPKLFARNERVVAYFDSQFGPFAMILVGAINVAAIETTWHGLVTPPHRDILAEYNYPKGQVELKKGEEMGRFNMGSTVILLTSQGFNWQPSCHPEQALRVGQKLATYKAPN